MQVEVEATSPTINGSQMVVETEIENQDVDKQLTQEDLSLLCDLFYLPFEHGGQGIQVLQEFNWLKSNAQIVMKQSKTDEPRNKADVSGINDISRP